MIYTHTHTQIRILIVSSFLNHLFIHLFFLWRSPTAIPSRNKTKQIKHERKKTVIQVLKKKRMIMK